MDSEMEQDQDTYQDDQENEYEELLDKEIDDEDKIVNDFYVDRPVLNLKFPYINNTTDDSKIQITPTGDR